MIDDRRRNCPLTASGRQRFGGLERRGDLHLALILFGGQCQDSRSMTFPRVIPAAVYSFHFRRVFAETRPLSSNVAFGQTGHSIIESACLNSTAARLLYSQCRSRQKRGSLQTKRTTIVTSTSRLPLNAERPRRELHSNLPLNLLLTRTETNIGRSQRLDVSLCQSSKASNWLMFESTTRRMMSGFPARR